MKNQIALFTPQSYHARTIAPQTSLGVKYLLAAMLAFCLLLSSPIAAHGQGAPFVNPQNIDYRGDVITLRAAPSRVIWAGIPVNTNTYSASYRGRTFPASYAPPTIRINSQLTPELKLTLTNNIGKLNMPCVMDHGYTNLHYHGFEVTPVSPSDDVVNIKVPTNTSFNYVVPFPQIPGKKHPEGMFWYHPHPHGCSNAQVNDGLSGALIVGDLLRSRYPSLVGIREQILLLKDGSLTPAGAQKELEAVLALADNPQVQQAPPRITVNALDKPRISIGAGEFQFFRIGNVGSNAYVNLALPNVEAFIIAADGFPTERPIPLDSSKGWILPPGSRVEMIVRGPTRPGVYQLVSLPLPAARVPDEVLATLEVPLTAAKRDPKSEARQNALQKEPSTPAAFYPLMSDFANPQSALQCQYPTPSPDPRYTFIFTQGGGQFFMNGRTYDENRVDVTCPIPSRPTWTIFNNTGQHHTFHIHQIHFRVDKIGDHVVTEDEAPIRDNVDVPPNTVVTMTMAFDETYLAGEFVLHCHILAHEDRGMMMNIQLHLLNAGKTDEDQPRQAKLGKVK
ncbi:MAG TPA: multicopper oxidase family protein [Candidatus Angelobacter sp.]|nr:multicopper oxidase family protein [Candidatus Angelobacter sp.]